MSLEILINGEWVKVTAESVAFRKNTMTINTKIGPIVIDDYQGKVRDLDSRDKAIKS